MIWFCTGPEGTRFELVEDYFEGPAVKVSWRTAAQPAIIPAEDFAYAASKWVTDRPERPE